MAEQNALTELSGELASVVERTALSVVRVDDGSRLTATGTIWSADGLIITTSHGVERDDELVIELGTGERLPATVVGRDNETDIALLRVASEGLAPLTQTPDADVKIGNLALALGRPGASGLVATLGIISARYDTQSNGEAEYIVNTDTTFYPGFSGGPLVDVQGRLVGLNNLSLGRGQGVALGVPILNHVTQSLLTQGKVKRGYLGISTQSVPLGETLRGTLGIEQERGLIIVQVATGSPGEVGGLLLGDTILALAGNAIYDAETLRKELRALNAGDTIVLQIVRGGQSQDLTLALGTLD